jgi:hypothetical protein
MKKYFTFIFVNSTSREVVEFILRRLPSDKYYLSIYRDSNTNDPCITVKYKPNENILPEPQIVDTEFLTDADVAKLTNLNVQDAFINKIRNYFE